MKITKKQLNKIIVEAANVMLNEERYDRYRDSDSYDRYRYSRKGRAAAQEKRRRRMRQIREQEQMEAKGKADAEAGRPRDESITHLAYHRAYDEHSKTKLDEGRSDYEAGYEDGMAGVDVRPSAMATRGEQEKKHANAEYRRGYVDGTIGRHSGKRPATGAKLREADRSTGEGFPDSYEAGYEDGLSGADIPPEFAANPSYRRGYADAEEGNYNPPESRHGGRRGRRQVSARTLARLAGQYLD